MNFEFAERINPELEKLNFTKAIEIAEQALMAIPATAFHAVLGQSLINIAEGLATWTDTFYQIAAKKIPVKALYFEMVEFDINTDLWFISCFAFSKDGGFDQKDMEWLCDFEADSQTDLGTVFGFSGLEELQSAFANFEPGDENMQNARDWCEQLIIARFMELMRAAHLVAKQKDLAWGSVPVYFTEHSYDFVVRSSAD